MAVPELSGPRRAKSPETPAPSSPPNEIRSDFSADLDAAAQADLDAALAEARAPAPLDAAPQGDGLMPREEWCQMFLGCHDIAGNVMGSAVLAGTSNRKGAMDAAGAIYDTCKRVSALRFMLSPDSEWFKSATLIAMFYLPLTKEIAAERRIMLARRAEAARAPSPRAPVSRNQDGVPFQGAETAGARQVQG
jgi:hypothetical protein